MKSIFKWILKIVKETLNQIFTMLGFFIAWMTMTGMPRVVVGIAIIWSLVIWLITIRFREGDD